MLGPPLAKTSSEAGKVNRQSWATRTRPLQRAPTTALQRLLSAGLPSLARTTGEPPAFLSQFRAPRPPPQLRRENAYAQATVKLLEVVGNSERCLSHIINRINADHTRMMTVYR